MASEVPPPGLRAPSSCQTGDANLQIEWDFSLFDELSELADVEDLLHNFSNDLHPLDPNRIDFDFDFNTWNLAHWSGTENLITDVFSKPGPQSPASTRCSESPASSVASSSSSSRCSESPAPSVASTSPHHVPEEVDLPLKSRCSPISLFADGVSGSTSELLQTERKAKLNTVSTGTVKQAFNTRDKLPQLICKPLIQPKLPVLSSVHISPVVPPVPSNTIIIQPLPTVLPVSKQQRNGVQSAQTNGHPLLLSQPTIVQLPSPPLVAAQPVITVPSGTPQLQAFNVLQSADYSPPNKKMAGTKPLVQTSAHRGSTSTDVTILRRQQRMIKNRESASMSRRKKKEYMLTLEERLKAALFENEKLKNENGSLKQQLEELSCQNQYLKSVEPKRRAVCVMVVIVFLALNFTPISVFQRDPAENGADTSPAHLGRHLLEFSESVVHQEPADNVQIMEQRPTSDQKALMVVKEEPLLYLSTHSCQPQINRSESLRLAHELRGWVHRHEVQRTKLRRTSNDHYKTQAVQKPEEKKHDVRSVVTVQYTDHSDTVAGSELQVYYAPHRNYQDFFEAIHRRGDTFYVVSFRRDHLLLPATAHNKTRRPKMSLLLPAMNVTESILTGSDYEVMMQIDCEIQDTKILHIKASLIPPFLREHQGPQNSSYYGAPSTATRTAPLSAISGSVQ
ncbi:cyclic AMP-dependent transcription factor ATF-6 alpha-like [Protopterus annectens]|uniref:cyclic AMP-dependent transcription factor ATF-6 alpha-like n=1 Tax=Protopterus annectens TaxID=7888 RepID=UPI001CFBCAE8|nr:cyclic AMP-dependent transcription factor ATF-6 alpha-like [Protopterus annectens]